MSTETEAFATAFDSPEEKAEFTPIPEGTYECSLREIKEEVNPFDQVQQTVLEYEICSGQHAARRVWDTVKHENKMAWKAVMVHRNFGLEGKPTNWIEWSQGVKGCKGKRFDVTLTQTVRDDKTYINVKKTKLSTELAPF